MRQRPGVIPARKRRFLNEFRQSGNLTEAARRAGVHRSTPYRWAEWDSDFKVLMEQAENEAVDRIELVAHNLATGKYMRMVVSAGKVLGEEAIYSEKMIEMLLRARRPERYNQKQQIEHSGSLRSIQELLIGIPAGEEDHSDPLVGEGEGVPLLGDGSPEALGDGSL